MILAPSILSADFGHMADELESIKKAGARYVHIDVMDGLMVPNISMGIPVISSLRKHSSLVFDVHLMIANPAKYIDDFIKAGADIITFHYEAVKKADIYPLIQLIQSQGKRCGVAIKPGTDFAVLENFLEIVDLILIMTVEPGFGGQGMIMESVEKVIQAKKIREANDFKYLIEVDGGVTMDNISIIFHAGADGVVAGSAIFKRGETYERTLAMVKAIEALYA